MFTLTNLEKAGLIKKSDASRNPFPLICKSFKLNTENVDENNPKDISYVFSGFAPLSIRLVQFILGHLVLPNAPSTTQKSLKLLDDSLKSVPGPSFEYSSQKESDLKSNRTTFSLKTGKSNVSSVTSPKKIIVCFVGGCTWSEIAALRLLQQQEEGEEPELLY